MASCRANLFARLAECEPREKEPPIPRGEIVRECAAIVVANLASFLLGGWLLSVCTG